MLLKNGLIVQKREGNRDKPGTWKTLSIEEEPSTWHLGQYQKLMVLEAKLAEDSVPI